MAEAEDVLVDAARHATVFIRDLWRRHQGRAPDAPVTLASLAPRLDLLLTAVGGRSLPLRTALPPAPPTLLERSFRRHLFPRTGTAVPATDGTAFWLPADLGSSDLDAVAQLYRAMALQQAVRARRGTARIVDERDPLVRDTALVLEARAAEAAVARALPGLVPALHRLRSLALAARPPLEAFASVRRPLECLLRTVLDEAVDQHTPGGASGGVQASLARARALVEEWAPDAAARRAAGPQPLYRDWWTGDVRAPDPHRRDNAPAPDPGDDDGAPVRSARMARRPEERAPDQDDDRPGEPGAWMIQQDHPHEQAEDPFGMQRPADRDEETSAEEFGDMLSELPSARLVSTPGRPREVLLSDDPPPSRMALEYTSAEAALASHRYPEWDFAAGAYRDPGTTVRLLPSPAGPQSWVDATLQRHRALIDGVRRQFEMLRAQRVRLRRQADGEDIDLDAWVESRADLRAGGAHNDEFYETRRPGQRSTAILLLVDASGSTDAWIGEHRRVIDVEREALLLVCIALQGLGEPYAIEAFSGEGPHGVTMRTLKRFDETYGNKVALRIAALEPERYTRAGAALRHATAQLMRQPAAHRLLMLLSDGKPNDADRYDGRYGVEDMRQAVVEARLQGLFPFCLTIDRQAAAYLPQVFGATGHALLPAPERLPLVLLDWMRRLVAR